MATTTFPTDLTTRIQSLLEERRRHVEAVADIDKTLQDVEGLLRTGSASSAIGIKRDRPVVARREPSNGSPTRHAKRRKRRSFGISADEFVIAFLRDNPNSATQPINQHWKESGRGGTADNTLSRLVKEKMLKRLPPTDGQRSGRYALA